MEQKLLEQLSDLSFIGYYDENKDAVVVHFFNKDNNKGDIVCFLLENNNKLFWDVRKVTSEDEVLHDTKEVITIKHERLNKFGMDSNFDMFIRKALYGMVAQEHPDINPEEVDYMFTVLKNNSY